MMSRLASKYPFKRLVEGLKEQGKTVAVVESCCGGLINASIMAIPGSSQVFYGGSVAYNTKQAQKFLMNDSELHSKLLQRPPPAAGESEASNYIQSKFHWTAETAKAFCEQNNVDYAIAEGGASGPTFRPEDLDKGFSVIAIAGKGKDGKAEILAQDLIRSPHANRQENMKLFADAAATLAADTIGIPAAVDDSDSNDQAMVEPSIPSLDRATPLRTDAAALEQLEAREDAKLVVIRNSNDCLFSADTQLAQIRNSEQLQELLKTFLGLETDSGIPIFGIEVNEESEALLDLEGENNGCYFDNTRTHAPLLSPEDYELALYATAQSQWKRTHKFCNICGGETHLIQGGTAMKCGGCGALSWPRQDPSIIVLITNRDGDKALLARSPRHPDKVHTAIAGFVEAGETFEMAVMREAYEETGIRVDPDSIEYLSSQPWPFPRSSMIGFRATADDTLPLNIDTDELVSAFWFEKDSVMAASQIPGAVMKHEIADQALKENPSLDLLIPPTGVLARSLIDDWLEDP
mmetsp:Transcript_45908/g.111208  ORF Transcript_45908/g.111208 Transcript_45908/m.111208 type:complete len:521 (+) Transcript_45908:42-1604(+)|eukprot:CAMPEP_0113661180 /NCGR_PEP_ID=MMETSP0017_2-20120614/33292_1 /TAXON_ID=2856 /ORGANISM="Cylindrotheca closterium" /LENGTH=520 /DNA_ID=CAMNT_0000575857 /DNA_START=12 /DNA_END=1574 /DNA_ORIENTATION=- /assembly_acc=CAM_ASM_000147